MDTMVILIDVDILTADISFHIGLDIIVKYQVTVINV